MCDRQNVIRQSNVLVKLYFSCEKQQGFGLPYTKQQNLSQFQQHSKGKKKTMKLLSLGEEKTDEQSGGQF